MCPGPRTSAKRLTAPLRSTPSTNLRPDVVFLDIQMPELTGLQVVERLRRLDSAPVVIFTTAYDRYAVAAFELEAVDYVLKPFGRPRFITALERARQCSRCATRRLRSKRRGPRSWHGH
jgi:two-component system LytT family response regulator